MNWDKFEKWFNNSFPKFLLGLLITVVCIFIIGSIIGGIKACITNSDKDYCVEFQDGSGTKCIFLNKGEFEIKDGYIIIKNDECVYYLSNFKLIDNK